MSVATFYLDDSSLKLPDEYEQNFLTAWKAIESGNVRNFSSALDSMHSALQESKPGLRSRYHDICICQVVVSKHKRVRCYYYMSLLAYAAIHNQKAIVDILIEKKACTWITSILCGSPLTQMLVYILHHGCREMIDEKMVAFLLDSIPREKRLQHNGSSNFDKNVVNYVPEKNPNQATMCSPIEMAIQLQRIDIAKRFVKAGADPICADVKLTEQVLPLFLEFYEFGTNHYFSWLLHEHIPHDGVSTFIDKVLERKGIIFHEYARENFEKESGRHHVHAPLTCGHANMIRRFLECFPKTDGEDTLRVKDSAGRTALQIAAANGDLESFTTLLEKYTQWVNRHGDDIDIAKALLAAAKANHVKIVDVILRKDDDAFENDNKLSVLHVEPKKSWHTWKIAVHEGWSCIFETLRHYNQRVTGDDFDEEGNTLGHIAARSGNVNLFKVVFPLERELPAEITVRKFNQQSKFENFSNCSMFWSLILENKKGETPLMVAIDNNHYNILESLQERTIERELRQNAKQNREKTEWKHFWKGCGCKLLVHACSSSSSRALDSVKVLINITKATLGFEELTRWTEAAFKGSVKVGNDEIVNYFLHNFPDETSDLKNQALLTASEYGHHRCVRILLKNNADVKATEDSDKNNCLMKAIENNHRETVLTILSDGKLGPQSLSFTRKRKCDRALWGCIKIGEYTEYIQPMTLLITHMPDIAEWVLNKCALSKPPPADHTDSAPSSAIEFDRGISREDEQKEAETDYEMEDPFAILKPPAADESSDDSELEAVAIVTNYEDSRVSTKWNVTKPHPVQTMVDYNRKDMLNHNLVQTWIAHELKDVVPDLIIYLLFYLLFLANLTIFSLLLPRPGPWNEYCVQNINTTSVEENVTGPGLLETLGGTCRGLSRHLVIFFYFDAVLLILTSIAYLILEVAQLTTRIHHYLKEVENYIQVIMFISVIIFVFPVGQNSCWCLPGWKWQIGALAVFFAWINLLLLIRYIPWLKVGERSTMMFNVYANFVSSLYLPILLLVTFAIPIYMIFVNVIPTEEGEVRSIFAPFTTPFTTLYRVIFLSAGEIGSENFTSTTFHYEEASIILFLLFIIAIPVLFNNFLIGMAVGETEEERQKANLSLTKRKIHYIFEVQNVLYRKIIPACTRLCCKPKKRPTLDKKNEIIQEFRAKDKAIKDDIKAKTRAKYTKRNVKRLKVLMTQNHNTLTLRNVELENSLQSLGGKVAEIGNETAKIKESVASVKEEMAEIKAILAKHFE